jgi:serine/threonine protein kinase
MAIAPGTILGSYRILSFLGAGSTGEVYLAEDERLGRKVAVKVVAPQHAENPDRLWRFEHEARAASSLNHPNIVTIHEIGTAGSHRFIVAEFVEGQTLRKRLWLGRLPIQEAAEIAAQIVSALESAHAAGIVHRDIKPENIMLRPDGYIKVLDFGLAKLLASPLEQVPVDSRETLPHLRTQPGWLQGTPLYMSPEQARGQPVDGRSDLFSLGIVLYEMVTGRSPFDGASVSDIIGLILHVDPAPLDRHIGEAPEILNWIVSKALAKNVEERYQSAQDFRIDLQQLKRQLGLGSGPRPDLATRPTGYARASKRLRWKLALGTILFLSLALLGVWLVQLISNRRPLPPSAPTMQMIATTGECLEASVSPDGKYVAYVTAASGKQALWLRQLTATPVDVQIVPAGTGLFGGLTFSPDSNYVHYILYGEVSSRAELYQISILGGQPRKLLTDIDNAVTFSRDGKQFAFIRNYPFGEVALFVANADGTEERRIAGRRYPEFLATPAWSPDRETIVCSTGSQQEERPRSLVAVRVRDGTETVIPSPVWTGIESLSWLSDGSGLVLTALDPDSRLYQIWEVSKNGRSRRITTDLSNYSAVSLSADSRLLLAIQENRVSNILVASGTNEAQVRQITSNKGPGRIDGVFGLAWTPQQKIVYVSRASGNEDIWIMEPDGSRPAQLTADPAKDLFPTVSPDGRYVVFVSDRMRGLNIWRIDIDGSNPKQLTSGVNETHPDVSRDSRWVVYSSDRTGRRTLWKVSIDGGEPAPLTDQLTRYPAVSPNGKLIACSYRAEKASVNDIALVPFEGGSPVKIFNAPPAAPKLIRWFADGQSLAFIPSVGGPNNIWRHSLKGGRPEQWTKFDADQSIFWFDLSPSGDLACARGYITRSVVMIRNFGVRP